MAARGTGARETSEFWLKGGSLDYSTGPRQMSRSWGKDPRGERKNAKGVWYRKFETREV